VKLQWRPVAPGMGPPIDTSLTFAETLELQRLAKDGDVLEIGSAYGYSTVAIGLVARSVVAVDPHTGHGSHGTLREHLHLYALTDQVEIVLAESQQALPRLYEEGRRFDMVWIDGDHTAAVVEHDVTWALKLLQPGGVLACHDYDEDTCPGVKVALDKLFGGPGDLTDTLAVYKGLA
jgi:predicted O-methyltransferase YrrM